MLNQKTKTQKITNKINIMANIENIILQKYNKINGEKIGGEFSISPERYESLKSMMRSNTVPYIYVEVESVSKLEPEKEVAPEVKPEKKRGRPKMDGLN
jgi:predicted RND superfamily exporter protein